MFLILCWSISRSSRTNTHTHTKVLFIIGDWNAEVGNQEIPEVTGMFGLGGQNKAGQRLTEFWQENALVIANTLFQQHKWAVGSITTNKARGGDEIPIELFQTLKDGAVKMLQSIYQEIWKTQQWPQDWKRSVFIPVPKKGNAKNVQTTTQLHSSHMLVK